MLELRAHAGQRLDGDDLVAACGERGRQLAGTRSEVEDATCGREPSARREPVDGLLGITRARPRVLTDDAVEQLVSGVGHPAGYHRHAMNEKVSLAGKLALIDDQWRPRIVAAYNENKVALVKVQGDFVWHKHEDTDDFFLVISGRLLVDLRDRTVELGPGELFVVPKGVEHRPRALQETEVLLIEPMGTRNTGDADSDRSAPEEWI